MSFQVGEEVGFLHEPGGGRVVRIDGGKIWVVDETGFDRPFSSSELAKIYSKRYDSFEEPELTQIAEDDEIETKYTARKEKRKGKDITVWEIDLHIEELVSSHYGMTNHEILTLQLRSMKNCLSEARKKHIPKVVVIHGEGKGRLREEVRLYLQGQGNLEFYDAQFSEYGKGATAVELLGLFG